MRFLGGFLRKNLLLRKDAALPGSLDVGRETASRVFVWLETKLDQLWRYARRVRVPHGQQLRPPLIGFGALTSIFYVCCRFDRIDRTTQIVPVMRVATK